MTKGQHVQCALNSKFIQTDQYLLFGCVSIYRSSELIHILTHSIRSIGERKNAVSVLLLVALEKHNDEVSASQPKHKRRKWKRNMSKRTMEIDIETRTYIKLHEEPLRINFFGPPRLFRYGVKRKTPNSNQLDS